MNKYKSCVITYGDGSSDINIYLPANPVKGRMVYIAQSQLEEQGITLMKE